LRKRKSKAATALAKEEAFEITLDQTMAFPPTENSEGTAPLVIKMGYF